MEVKKSKTAKKRIENIIEIPEGFDVEVSEKEIKIKKNGEEIERKLSYPITKQNNQIIIKAERPTKKNIRLMNTTLAHIRNIISGLQEKYVYKLQIASVHFPMSVNVHGNEIIIKNFLGETKDRKAKILPGAEVKIEKDIITVGSSDKEKAGQTAANIETATKIKARDRRIFQDGIYIIEKQKGRKKRK